MIKIVSRWASFIGPNTVRFEQKGGFAADPRVLNRISIAPRLEMAGHFASAKAST